MNLSFITILLLSASVIFPNGRNSVLGETPINNELVVAGDSYARHFFDDEKKSGTVLYEYTASGTTIEENKEKLMQAFDSLHKIILLSISVNDQMRGTHPAVFEKNYRDLLDKGAETEKLVFVHTYIHYPLASTINYNFPTYVYDSIVRQLASEYDNVYYIDMSDCEEEAFSTGDGIHYSKNFNDILLDRLNKKIEEVQSKVYE